MDRGRYIDFKGESPNTFYTFEYENGVVSFKKVTTPDVVAGDSDSFMLSIKDVVDGLSEDEIVEIADSIGDYVNKSMEDLLLHVFNTPEERKTTIHAAREVVSDVSLFLSKKRYVMRVIDTEGKRGRSVKVKGIETVKSDTSIAVKDILNELIDLILDGSGVEEINQAINRLKRDFYQRPIHDIARPTACKTMNTYSEFYGTPYIEGEDGKRKKITIPYMVLGALNYNSLCSITDRKIMPGEKILFFYTKGKMKHMAVPVDINNMPDFVEDIVVDYDKMWEGAYKKIVSYLKSIGYDIESRKKTQRKNLFGF